MPVTDLGLAAIITAVSGAIVALYSLWRSKGMDAAVKEAGINSQQTINFTSLVEALQKDNEYLRREIDALREENKGMRRRIVELENGRNK